jgi:DNA-binding NarL/FixJ family response regulator
MSGVELAAQAWKENPAMRVLFMSGYNESEVLRHGVRARTMRLLRKPFTMEELVQAVRESISAPTGDPGRPTFPS